MKNNCSSQFEPYILIKNISLSELAAFLYPDLKLRNIFTTENKPYYKLQQF
jgi:hypothetical protein